MNVSYVIAAISMPDMIAAGIIAVIVCAASIYIFKQKKKGVKCIGCPYAGKCHASGENSGTCNCGQGGTSTENSCDCRK